jgi:hypothetical protein
MRHPFYFVCCALSCGFLYYANHRGYSLWSQTLLPRGSGAGSHSSSYYHK